MTTTGFSKFDKPKYDTQKTLCHKFLTEFEDDGQSVYQDYGRRKYLIALVSWFKFYSNNNNQ